MKTVSVSLRAESPISIRTGRDEPASQTLRYIPGQTLRGALAAAHRLLRPGKDEEFGRFFLSGDVQFGNAYPCEPGSGEEAEPSRPVPLTARSCKRYPGFGGVSEEQHGVADMLLPSLLFELSGGERVELLASVQSCTAQGRGTESCGEPLQRVQGFMRRDAATEQYDAYNPLVELTTHIGISRTRGTAHDGALFEQEALLRGSLFESECRGDESVLLQVVQFAEEAAQVGALRVGRSRTRGLGEVAVDGVRQRPGTETSKILKRLAEFQSRLQRLSEEYELPLPQGTFIPLTLTSDVILQDELGRYVGTPGEEELKAIGFPDGSRTVWSAAEARRIMGWDGLLGLPKADEWGWAMGSTFVFFVPEEATDLVDILAKLESGGLGRRRTEGFGRVVVADSFHVEVGQR